MCIYNARPKTAQDCSFTKTAPCIEVQSEKAWKVSRGCLECWDDGWIFASLLSLFFAVKLPTTTMN